MMHVHTLHKTAILVKPGHILCRKYPLVFPLMSTDCSASTLWFTEDPKSNVWASCRLKQQLQHRVVAGDSSAKTKGCRHTEQSSNTRRKTGWYFLHKIRSSFTKIAVLCDIWMYIVKFHSSKPQFTVKVTQCCFKQIWVMHSNCNTCKIIPKEEWTKIYFKFYIKIVHNCDYIFYPLWNRLFKGQVWHFHYFY